ncbi:MAG: DinB family protein [Gordonia sp. (in: high G+C Gram-positive bacteria)]|uniref:mycothiol transferase n=1 Tax=Gordonia sp. (in: high G+C Gram-positive bacteria) TaxID=84139 RepID=UPI003C72233F
MDVTDLLSDMAQRPVAAAEALPLLTVDQLNAHPGDHPNSVAWLLWHSARQADVQLADLTGAPPRWSDYRDRFDLGPIGDTMGYGHAPEQAAQIRAVDQQLLIDYLREVLTELSRYAGTLSPADLDAIVDRRWDPPVARGVRLVSIIDDAAQHVGQAAYAAGILTADDV